MQAIKSFGNKVKASVSPPSGQQGHPQAHQSQQHPGQYPPHGSQVPVAQPYYPPHQQPPQYPPQHQQQLQYPPQQPAPQPQQYPPQQRPAQREHFALDLFDACKDNFGWGCFACVCPFPANAVIWHYVASGHPEYRCWRCCCSVCCFNKGALCGVRTLVRARTGMRNPDCCVDGCTAICWMDFLAATFCWGPALAQERRELEIHYGHRPLPPPGQPAHAPQPQSM